MCVCDNLNWMENGWIENGLSGCGEWRGSGSHTSMEVLLHFLPLLSITVNSLTFVHTQVCLCHKAV